jgi:hypothetical protein
MHEEDDQQGAYSVIADLSVPNKNRQGAKKEEPLNILEKIMQTKAKSTQAQIEKPKCSEVTK